MKGKAIEKMDFDELIRYGIAHCGNKIHDGIPWSFDYKGLPVTHETNTCYIINLPNGQTMKVTPDDFVIITEDGQVGVVPKILFQFSYYEDK